MKYSYFSHNYYKKVKISDPAYSVIHISGSEIQKKAEKYFRGKLLDVGCGSKDKIHLVGNYVEEYVGVDHEKTLHDKSKVDIFCTAYDIPEPSESYDSLLCTAVLEHLEEPKRALKEAFRLLKPGGYALYTVPLFWHLHEEPRDFFRYTAYGLEYLFRDAGFDIVEIMPMSGFWITFGTELNYYLRRFNKGVMKLFVSMWITLSNILLPKLDRGFLRDEKFTWLYLVVVKKPTTIINN